MSLKHFYVWFLHAFKPISLKFFFYWVYTVAEGPLVGCSDLNHEGAFDLGKSNNIIFRACARSPLHTTGEKLKSTHLNSRVFKSFDGGPTFKNISDLRIILLINQDPADLGCKIKTFLMFSIFASFIYLEPLCVSSIALHPIISPQSYLTNSLLCS